MIKKKTLNQNDWKVIRINMPRSKKWLLSPRDLLAVYKAACHESEKEYEMESFMNGVTLGLCMAENESIMSLFMNHKETDEGITESSTEDEDSKVSDEESEYSHPFADGMKEVITELLPSMNDLLKEKNFVLDRAIKGVFINYLIKAYVHGYVQGVKEEEE